MKVIKYSGDIVEFDSDKLRRSLLKSGADNQIIDKILENIQSRIFEGITTKQIYKWAFGMLKNESNAHAARYNLRDAIQQLGPAGYFFEKYVGRIFSQEKYETITNLNLQGRCVSHEIDVLIKKNEIVSMIECKFHGRKEFLSDVKVPMYILSRFNDLKEKKHNLFTKDEFISKCWIVTNNRFSKDAIDFSICTGIHLLSWDFPIKNNIRHKIDNHKLYPITCLTTLTLAEKEKLLLLNILLVGEISNEKSCLDKINLSAIRKKNILKEVFELCK
jgi:hypothetical protein